MVFVNLLVGHALRLVTVAGGIVGRIIAVATKQLLRWGRRRVAEAHRLGFAILRGGRGGMLEVFGERFVVCLRQGRVGRREPVELRRQIIELLLEG